MSAKCCGTPIQAVHGDSRVLSIALAVDAVMFVVEVVVGVVILSAVILFAFGCGQPRPEEAGQKSRPTAPAPAAEPKRAALAPAPGPEHAAAGVKPGSYEDWCEEHQVPESQCTRCNPALTPAFKATGDWCEEHGVPESQCTRCNPNLKITRPPKGS